MKKRNVLIVISLAVILSLGSVWAYFTDTVQVKNTIQTGIVEISIDEYEKTEDGEEKPYEDPKEIIPGDQISKIVRITNREESAYIRAKVEFQFENEELNGSIGIENLTGVEETNWIYKNGYFYYKKPVNSGEVITLFQGVSIPESWDNTYANCRFHINVTAEAVQSANLEPNYETEDPWNGIEIQACAYPKEERSENRGDGE